MTIALVNSGATFGTAASIAAPALNVGSGNLLVVFGRNSGGNTQTLSVSDTAGNTFTQIATASMSASDLSALFYAKNTIANASDTITLSSTVSGSIGISVVQYSGADTVSPLDVSATGSVDTGTPATSVTSGTFTTTSANEVIVAGFSVNATGSVYTAGAGYTIEVQDASNVTAIEDKIVAAIQTNATAGASDASHGWEMIVATFKAAAGAFAPKARRTLSARVGSRQAA